MISQVVYIDWLLTWLKLIEKMAIVCISDSANVSEIKQNDPWHVGPQIVRTMSVRSAAVWNMERVFDWIRQQQLYYNAAGTWRAFHSQESTGSTGVTWGLTGIVQPSVATSRRNAPSISGQVHSVRYIRKKTNFIIGHYHDNVIRTLKYYRLLHRNRNFQEKNS